MRLDPTDAGYGTAADRHQDLLTQQTYVNSVYIGKAQQKRLAKLRTKKADQTHKGIAPAMRKLNSC